MRTVLKLIVVAILAAIAYVYYGLVFPAALAAVVAVVLFGALAVAALTGRIPWRLLLAGGPVVAVWPAGALLAEWLIAAGGLTPRWGLAAGWSWVLPLAAHKIEAALAERRDRARDLGGLVMGSICLYLVVVLGLYRPDAAGAAAAALGTAAATLTVREHLLLGPAPRAVLALVAGLAGLSAALLGLRAWLS
ncbi:hypothetical protein [Vulcaniibacterium gelatinicum]|uniref:hypothetical protein n=1 Tax=Vulcaniibacterium gelatinicum TaxID=2598725 RepID=UPI0011CC81F8|nr:hypothetical protein [Vulcaniibacterium gelatinicum]